MIGPSRSWNAVLQLVYDHAPTQCFGYSGLPLLDPVQVAIVSSESSVDALATQLFQATRQALLNLIAPTAAETSCGGPATLAYMARAERACRRVLVLLTDGTPVSAATIALLHQWRRGPRFDDVILPVVPAGANPSMVLPAPFDTLQVLRRPAAVADLEKYVQRNVEPPPVAETFGSGEPLDADRAAIAEEARNEAHLSLLVSTLLDADPSGRFSGMAD